jgi:hypothetical protein
MNESFARMRSAITSDISIELAYSITSSRQFQYILFLLKITIERCDLFISQLGSSIFWKNVRYYTLKLRLSWCAEYDTWMRALIIHQSNEIFAEIERDEQEQIWVQ